MSKHVEAIHDPNIDDDFAASIAESLRQIEASQRLTEMLTTQVFMRFAHATGDMSGFVNVVLDNMEIDLRRAVGHADPKNRDAALDVVDYFESLKARVLAMIPAKAALN